MKLRNFCLTVTTVLLAATITGVAFADTDVSRERERDGDDNQRVPTYSVQPYLTGLIGRWWTVGTVSRTTAGIWTVGDFIGYDTADVDGDMNPQTIWYFGAAGANIGSDSDGLISKDAYYGDSALKFTGCIPGTSVSYHWVAMFVPNQSFTGAPGTAFTNSPFKAYDVGLGTRWEEPGVLQVIRVLPEAITTIQSVPLPAAVTPAYTADGFCGTYELRRQAGNVSVKVNGVKVFTAPSVSTVSGSRAIDIRTFERPATFSSLVWKSLDD